ncbi:MAG: ABC transporter related protein [Parcubacteria group bacterium GW2011_GWA2_39_18]|nr:MAG: ABC transporter related protein [Parcubacteria group bacterium GW2011_GWA2_39_18]
MNTMEQSNSQKILKVKNLTVAFDDNVVIDNLNFEVEKGEMLSVIGPNGSGKTVLVRALLGLAGFTGSVEWKKDIKIGYVPQHFFVESDTPLTVEEFFKFKTSKHAQIHKALEQVGWQGSTNPEHFEHHLKSHLLNQQLGKLSGGQLQRILIAWSLIDNPDVLLYDEPTSGIDAGAEETIYSTLLNLKDKYEMTIIFVSHELSIVYNYATKVLCLNKEKFCYGEPEDILGAENLSKLYGEKMKFYSHQHLQNNFYDK